MANTRRWEGCDPNILCSVIRLLRPIELVFVVRNVNQQWRRASYLSRAWEHSQLTFPLQQYDEYSDGRCIKKWWLGNYINQFTGLVMLDATNTSCNLSIQGLCSLTSLSLCCNSAIDDAYFVQLSGLSRLTFLNIAGCYSLTPAALSVLDYFTSLGHLVVPPHGISDQSMIYIGNRYHTLTHLQPSGTFPDEMCWDKPTEWSLTVSGFGQLARLIHLTTLDLSGVQSYVTDDAISNCCEFNNLTELNLSYCRSLIPTTLQRFRRCHNLKSLIACSNPIILGRSFLHCYWPNLVVVHIGIWTNSNPLFGPLVSACPSLRELGIHEDRATDQFCQTNNTPHIDHDDFAHLLELRQLETFSFSTSLNSPSTVDGRCLEVLFKIPSLESLGLSGCRAIVDADLSILSSHVPALHKLYLNGSSIQGPGLELLLLMSSLKELSLPCTRNVTFAYVQCLLTNLTRLTLLCICNRQIDSGISREERAILNQDNRVQLRFCYHQRAYERSVNEILVGAGIFI